MKKKKKNGSSLKTGKKHGKRFKEQAVRLSRQADISVAQPGHDKELEQLRRELRRVTWELDFLKEAAAFLARASGSATR